MIQVNPTITIIRVLLGLQTFSIPLYIIGYWSVHGGRYTPIDMIPLALLGLNFIFFILCWSRSSRVWLFLFFFLALKIVTSSVYWISIYSTTAQIPTPMISDLLLAALYLVPTILLGIKLFRRCIK